jgi:hypothetical protein
MQDSKDGVPEGVITATAERGRGGKGTTNVVPTVGEISDLGTGHGTGQGTIMGFLGEGGINAAWGDVGEPRGALVAVRDGGAIHKV